MLGWLFTVVLQFSLRYNKFLDSNKTRNVILIGENIFRKINAICKSVEVLKYPNLE